MKQIITLTKTETFGLAFILEYNYRRLYLFYDLFHVENLKTLLFGLFHFL